MSSDVFWDDMKIASLMRDSGEGASSPIEEFKFWSNIFYGIKFFYDHLKVDGDVKKVRSIDRQKMFQNISSYLMRGAVLSRGLFDSDDDFEKHGAWWLPVD